MSDTPLCDAQFAKTLLGITYVEYDFSRSLERSLNASNKEIEALKHDIERAQKTNSELCEEIAALRQHKPNGQSLELASGTRGELLWDRYFEAALPNSRDIESLVEYLSSPGVIKRLVEYAEEIADAALEAKRRRFE